MELVTGSGYYPRNKRIACPTSPVSRHRKKLKSVTSSRLPSLPEDIIFEILLRLPVISLLRFKSVCSRWYTIIRSSSFIHKHVRMGSDFTSNIVHWQDMYDENGRDVEGYQCSIFPDGTLESDEIPFPCSLYNVMHGSCNGILCVSGSSRSIALWNPATRKFRPVPFCPYIVGRGYIPRYDIGFGEDPTTGDLKIVLFDNDWSEKCRVSVYNSRTDSWKLIQEGVRFVDSELVPNRFGRTFSNGVLYWVKFHKITHKTCILAFDTRKDLFEEIAAPDILKQYKLTEVEATLDFFDDTLALFFSHFTVDRKRMDIWLMTEKGRWTKHKTVLLPLDSETPFAVWNQNQIYTHIKDGLIVYDLASDNTESVAKVLDHFPYICRYKESLVQLEGNGIHEFDTELDGYTEFH